MDQVTTMTLDIQTKVLEQLDMQTADSSKRARKILDIFRRCNPDEFGLIHLASFHRHFGKQFGLTSNESSLLFNIGDTSNNLELDYAAFRNVFVSIDTDMNALIPPPHYGGLRKLDPPGSSSSSSGKGNDGTAGSSESAGAGAGAGGTERLSEHSIVQGMARDQRDKYLQHKRIQQLLEYQLRELERRFIIKEPARLGMHESMVRTKVTFVELFHILSSMGMNMTGLDARELEEMFQSDVSQELMLSGNNGGNGGGNGGGNSCGNSRGNSDVPKIGFSELIKASDLYFSLLGSSQEDIQHQIQYTKLHDQYGRRLGRRKVGTGPAAGGHLSQPGFLAHDDGRLGIASPDSLERTERLSRSLSSNHFQQSEGGVGGGGGGGGGVGGGVGGGFGGGFGGGVVAGVASHGQRTQYGTMFTPLQKTGCMPQYDQAFNDPDKNLWEQRWLDKSLGEERKRKLAKKALLGNNDMAKKQNHDMFSRLTFVEGGQRTTTPTLSTTMENLMMTNGGESRPWATGLNWS